MPDEGLSEPHTIHKAASDGQEIGKDDNATASSPKPEADEFGLPMRPRPQRQYQDDRDDISSDDGKDGGNDSAAVSDRGAETLPSKPDADDNVSLAAKEASQLSTKDAAPENSQEHQATVDEVGQPGTSKPDPQEAKDDGALRRVETIGSTSGRSIEPVSPTQTHRRASKASRISTDKSAVSEWSHQQLAPRTESKEEEEASDGEWQSMPAFATHRIYDDWGKVLAKEYGEVDDEYGYGKLGGAGKGYTRVQLDDDAQSATSMDDNTAYLFKEQYQSNALQDEDDEARDAVSQMRATKELLTEGQRIAYVGLVRLSIGKMLQDAEGWQRTKGAKKAVDIASESLKLWGQKIMVRLYAHMEIDSREQVMVEQLAEHGVLPSDLTPALMQNAKVKNPVAQATDTDASGETSGTSSRSKTSSVKGQEPDEDTSSSDPEAPPAYEDHRADELTIEDPQSLDNTKDLELDIRWTVLCDLFLLFVSDSTYDARSRTLLNVVGSALSVEWQEICRFEKRVTDALEMQEQADQENWNEEEHIAMRRKEAMKRRMMIMGLCTVGGGLVIGLSAGLLAPVIGAGLAAGFTTIGVAGTSTFLAGTGAAAAIGTTGALTGSIIGVRASNRRTGAVKTFEYRPLFNNKRTNLILTVSGWMTGKVDDVRLPFSTVNPIMGDIYSLHWEPEMLQVVGQTIQVLATEALTQTIQGILGTTILAALMAGLSVPLMLTKLSYLIDNPWTVSLARADAAGLILADSLIDRNLGSRPVTLVGFSLGARVIFGALRELAQRGAHGLVQDVYLFGSPIVAKTDEYIRARTIVSGRFVNAFATNDWILGYLFRATSGGVMRISGLASVDVAGVENKDVTELVPGHMAYRAMMPVLLEECGWNVESHEFSEIEDPDPENHEKRQRELIDEIEAARLEMEAKKAGTEKKGGLKAFFTRKRVTKREWETYDDRSQKIAEASDSVEAEKIAAENSAVMFDVDAIRREALALAVQGGDIEEIKRHMNIREIQSTLPALKIDSPRASSSVNASASASPATPTKKAGEKDERSKALPSQPESDPEPEPEMSFEPSSPPTARKGTAEAARSPSPQYESINYSKKPQSRHNDDYEESGARSPPRPPLRTFSSRGNDFDPDVNPWDESGDDGRGKEVKMTFE